MSVCLAEVKVCTKILIRLVYALFFFFEFLRTVASTAIISTLPFSLVFRDRLLHHRSHLRYGRVFFSTFSRAWFILNIWVLARTQNETLLSRTARSFLLSPVLRVMSSLTGSRALGFFEIVSTVSRSSFPSVSLCHSCKALLRSFSDRFQSLSPAL